MKLKYYLRGLGIGIIVTTVLLMIAFALHKPVMSDADVINRAKQLGMIMPEDEEPLRSTENTDNGTIEGAAPYTLVVNRGDVCRVVCENLQANGIVDDAEAFRKFLAQKGFASSISVGSYTIPYGLDYEEIYQILKLGPQ